MPAVLPDYKPRRPIYGDRLGFFRGAVCMLVAAAWIVGMVLLITTSP